MIDGDFDRLEEIKECLIFAEEGDAFAQNLMGASLATGWYVEQDITGAFYWYCQAIKQGYVDAKWNAGTMLLFDNNWIEKHEQLGLRLIREAAEAKHYSACMFLSDHYQDGSRGFEINSELALYWQQRAEDYEHRIDFNQPIDVEEEYHLILKKPMPLRKKE